MCGKTKLTIVKRETRMTSQYRSQLVAIVRKLACFSDLERTESFTYLMFTRLIVTYAFPRFTCSFNTLSNPPSLLNQSVHSAIHFSHDRTSAC